MNKNANLEQGPAASGAVNASGGAVSPEASGINVDGDQGVEVPAEDFVPRSVMEAQIQERERKWQSTHDKQMADYNKRLAELMPAQQPTQPLPQQPQPANDFSNDTFEAMLNEDPAKARQYFFSFPENKQQPQQPVNVQAEIQAALQADRQAQQAQAQYVASMDQATQGLTAEEKQRAEMAAAEHFQANGTYLAPYEAVVIGRFGSLEQAVTLANAQMMQLSGRPIPAPQIPTPPVTANPGLPGGGLARQQPAQSIPPGGSKAGMWRGALG